MTRSILLVVVLSIAAACSSANPAASPSVELDSEVTLAPGETATVRDKALEIGFVEVTEDSRCPTDAQCVGAGEVKVRLSLRQASGEPARPEVREGEASALGSYRVTVVKVMPFPTTTRTIRQEEYRATLKVTAQ